MDCCGHSHAFVHYPGMRSAAMSEAKRQELIVGRLRIADHALRPSSEFNRS
jgi:hypothetical protein